MVKEVLFALCATAVSVSAHCSDSIKQQRLDEYMAVVNFDDAVSAQINSCKSVMRKSAESSRTLGRGLPPADEELSRSLHEIEISLMKLCEDAFPLVEARKIYADQIDSSLDSDDLAKIIAFLKSPLGQKYAAARSNATTAWQEDTTIRMQKSMMVMKSHISERVADAIAKFKARVKADK
jgi:hypothetical protein